MLRSILLFLAAQSIAAQTGNIVDSTWFTDQQIRSMHLSSTGAHVYTTLFDTPNIVLRDNDTAHFSHNVRTVRPTPDEGVLIMTESDGMWTLHRWKVGTPPMPLTTSTTPMEIVGVRHADRFVVTQGSFDQKIVIEVDTLSNVRHLDTVENALDVVVDDNHVIRGIQPPLRDLMDFRRIGFRSFISILSVSGDGERLYRTIEGPNGRCWLVVERNGVQQTLVSSDDGDILPIGHTIDDRTGDVIFAVSTFGTMSRHIVDSRYAHELAFVTSITRREVAILGRSRDGTTYLVRTNDGGPFLYLRGRLIDGKTIVDTLAVDPPAPDDGHRRRQRFVVTSRDGRRLPCSMVRADSTRPGPTIIAIHGGPWVPFLQNSWYVTRIHRMLADRGWNVIHAEFRGTPGYGRDFIEASRGEWGRAMRHDLEDIADAAIQSGTADRSTVALYGWSYGAYAVLDLLTSDTAQRFVGGIALYGVYDLVDIMRSPTGANDVWWSYVGNPAVREDSLRLVEASPIHRVNNLHVPLLVSHGALDERCAIAHSDNLVDQCRQLGKNVTYVRYDDEGHDYSRPSSWLRLWNVAAPFLDSLRTNTSP
ncbi:MAG TPA: hypothetical protein DIS79_00790 [Bacteroidetes bacterium]|nr:hypothetical protein [Bacteroidota bacterium]HRK06077.1 prolyl oligopeptidase family serine peptidase [Chlorobiota bacterium]